MTGRECKHKDRDDKRSLRRSQLYFSLIIGVFVLVVSFFYGLAQGLSQKAPKAHAGFAFDPGMESLGQISERVRLPQGAMAVPMGEDVTVNNRSVDAVAFVSRRPVEDLVREQLDLWKADGLSAIHRMSESHAVAIAANRTSGERYSLVVWAVPKRLRAAVSRGYPVQGTLAVAAGERQGGGEQEEVSGGAVPGVPLMPGGSAGSVFSSRDRGVRSYSSVYTNPGRVWDSVEFYRSALAEDGWQEIGRQGAGEMTDEMGFLNFVQHGQELSLLFNSVVEQEGNQPQTLVTIIMGPQKGAL